MPNDDEEPMPPARSLKWVADIGPRRNLGELADHLRDLDHAVELGERIDVLVTIAISRQEIVSSVLHDGPGALTGEAENLGLSYDDLDELHRWLGNKRRMFHLHPEHDLRTGLYFRAPTADVLDLIATARAARIRQKAGRPHVVSASYRNPIEILLCGVLPGVALILRMIRDWSSMRRVGTANASVVESRARQDAARADVAEWISREIRANRLSIPPQAIAELAASSNVESINRLAQSEISLEPPPGAEE